MSDKLPRGIQSTPYGYRAFVHVVGHPPHSKRFKRQTDLAVMKLWRERERAAMILDRQEREAEQAEQEKADSTFAADAERYLKAVAGMPSIKERKRQIAVWVAAFGDRPRADIRRDEIAALRDQWKLRGPRIVQIWKNRKRHTFEVEKPLSASAINHRLRALSNLWTVLDGRRAPNPVRDVAELQEPDLQPRAIDYRLIEKVLKQIRDGKSKARLSVMAYCGIRPAQLKQIAPADVNLKARTVTLASSKKGKKHRRTPTKPLTDDGVKAFKLMHRESAWGTYSQSALNHTWQRACRKLKLEQLKGVRAYDLRHSFGTRMLLKTRDLSTVAEFLDHGDLRTTQRYTLAVRHRLMHEAAKQW